MEQRETNDQYDMVVKECSKIFAHKTTDYGTAWRVLRPISIVDQIYIKAQRIRTIQEKKTQKIADNVSDEFAGIINYATIGLIQLELTEDAPEDLPPAEAIQMYQHKLQQARQLMQQKNHDYGEAWRSMSQESFVDLILMKLYRMRQIIANEGKTIISEGLDANYLDIINYAVFASILLHEQKA